MSEEQYHNKQWGVEDFKRYHAGQMPLQEMHALEKASLDDPFLEDALEGYAFTKTPVEDIEELKQRLTPKKEEAKIIWYKQKGSVQFLRVAAMLVLFAGFSWLLYQNKVEKKEEIASMNKQVVVSEKPETIVPETIISNSTTIADSQTKNEVVALPEVKRNKPTNANDVEDEKQAIAELPRRNEVELSTLKSDISKESNAVADAPIINKTAEVALAGKVAGVNVRSAKSSKSNIITGRVVDKTGQPVAYATIKDQTNKQHFAADKDGNFYLPNSQNASNIQIDVNAVGYATTNASLNQGDKENKIVLQESDKELSEVVVTGYAAEKQSQKTESNTQRKKSEELKAISKVSLDNATPIEGWENFNLSINELFKSGIQIDTTGLVILSFDIDSSGIAKNISIIKSLCPLCDEEAKRILQSAPAMKKNKKNKKAEATIRY